MWPNEQLSPSKWLIMYYSTFWLNVWACHVIDCSVTPVYGLGVSRPESVFIPAECTDFRDQLYDKPRAIFNLLIGQWTYNICMRDYASCSYRKHPKQAWPRDMVPELLWRTLLGVCSQTELLYEDSQLSVFSNTLQGAEVSWVLPSVIDKTLHPETPSALNYRSELWSSRLCRLPGITHTWTHAQVFLLQEWQRIKI